MDQRIQLSKQKVISDFNIVIADAEELLRATTDQTGERIVEMRSRIQEHLTQAKGSLADAKEIFVDKAREVSHAAEDYVQNYPWRSVSVAMGLGLVVGMFIGRR